MLQIVIYNCECSLRNSQTGKKSHHPSQTQYCWPWRKCTSESQMQEAIMAFSWVATSTFVEPPLSMNCSTKRNGLQLLDGGNGINTYRILNSMYCPLSDQAKLTENLFLFSITSNNAQSWKQQCQRGDNGPVQSKKTTHGNYCDWQALVREQVSG